MNIHFLQQNWRCSFQKHNEWRQCLSQATTRMDVAAVVQYYLHRQATRLLVVGERESGCVVWGYKLTNPWKSGFLHAQWQVKFLSCVPLFLLNIFWLPQVMRHSLYFLEYYKLWSKIHPQNSPIYYFIIILDQKNVWASLIFYSCDKHI